MSEHEAERGGAGSSRAPFQGWPLPLNSKRLTGVLLKQLAVGLEVPSAASGDEVRQLIEGKLGEMGREPRNAHVVLQDTLQGTRIGLQDSEGMFLDLVPERSSEDPSHREQSEEETEGGGEEELESLRRILKETSEQRDALQAEVSTLHDALAGEKRRARDMWKMNCM